MHVRRIEETALNGMVLRHTQTLPEICYRGCVICFLRFDGDIEGVGTRIIDLTAEEFETFKELIGMIEFEGDEPDYVERAKQSLEIIKKTAERVLSGLETDDYIWSGDVDKLRESIAEVELINAKLARY